MDQPIVSVILSGGAGTRLWPVSREAAPKPFMDVQGRSLLRKTFERGRLAGTLAHTLVVTNRAYADKTRGELGRPAQADYSLLLEPAARNIAPAVGMAALWVRERFGADAVLLVLPADHEVGDEGAYASAVRSACAAAASGRLMLFGIRPAAPETGFGYMQVRAGIEGLCDVLRFVEKPDAATARSYLASGDYLWDSGMFCFTVGALLDALQQHAPEVAAGCASAFAGGLPSGESGTVYDAAAFARIPNISLGYAVMERAANVGAVACEIDWDDVGTWNAVADLAASDADGNAAEGPAALIDARGTYIRSTGRYVAAVGVQDIFIVEAPDAVLVASEAASQKVKSVVDALKRSASALAVEHATVERPWGTYTTLNEGERFKIKRIEVKPVGQLSLQMHHHRSEHWVVVNGVAKVSRNDREFLLSPNESTFIPVGSRHRLENPGKLPLLMIEVQCGDYVGEDDIVRFSDVYGRVPVAG
jgi:mannose-1-phosphate guanylyltransferase